MVLFIKHTNLFDLVHFGTQLECELMRADQIGTSIFDFHAVIWDVYPCSLS